MMEVTIVSISDIELCLPKEIRIVPSTYSSFAEIARSTCETLVFILSQAGGFEDDRWKCIRIY